MLVRCFVSRLSDDHRHCTVPERDGDRNIINKKLLPVIFRSHWEHSKYAFELMHHLSTELYDT